MNDPMPLRFTLGTKAMLGYGVMFVMLAALAGFSISEVRWIDRNLATINDVNALKQRYAINFRGSVHDRAIDLRDVTLVASQAERAAVLASIARLTEMSAQSAIKLDRMLAYQPDASLEERAILASIKQTEARTLPLIHAVVAAQEAGEPAKARSLLMRDARPAFTEWLARINQFIDLQEARNQAIGSEVRSVAKAFTLLMMTLCGLASLLSFGFAFWSCRSIRPLRPLTTTMLKLAEGDLDVPVPDTRQRDEVGDISRAVQTFKD